MSAHVRSSMYFLHTKYMYLRFFLCWKNSFLIIVILQKKGPACTDPEGWDRGVQTSLEYHKAIGFLSNTGPDPMENHKATKPAFNVGPLSALQRNTV